MDPKLDLSNVVTNVPKGLDLGKTSSENRGKNVTTCTVRLRAHNRSAVFSSYEAHRRIRDTKRVLTI